MTLPVEMNPPPSIWVPVRARTQILLPFNSQNRRANPQWLHTVLGDRVQVNHAGGGAWEVVRRHADALLLACVERFGPGATTVITDAAQQTKCGKNCQQGNPENALYCECRCGGRNHGGVAGWQTFNEFAIETEVTRCVFKV